MQLYRFIAMVAALLLVLGTTACGSDAGGEDGGDPARAPSGTEEPSQPSGDDSGLADEPETSDGSGASLRGPEGWEFDDSGQFGTDFLFLNPEPDELEGQSFAANVNVLSEPAQGLDTEGYAEAGAATLPQLLTGYTSVEERDVEVAGKPARLIGGTFEQGVFKLRNVQLITVADDTGYTVTGTALAQDWDEYAELFEASLLSFSTE
jgi:hypothetical protein